MISTDFEDNIEAFQLKECYDIALRFEQNDIARSIITEKFKGIDIPRNYIPVQLESTHKETEMQVISEILYELSLEGLASPENRPLKSAHKINSLPSSGEKEYILALLALRSGTNESQRIDALRHITAALSYSPNDPRYVTFACVLKDIDK